MLIAQVLFVLKHRETINKTLDVLFFNNIK